MTTLEQISREIDFETPAILKVLAQANRYLDTFARLGILKKARLGRESYYPNTGLINLLLNIAAIHRANRTNDRDE
ncbi:hypothetical protein [Candidatus Spongiihabitans sp.]|uniref:hypothetical protein n=1 Tax=Candidatus Spongiihabitans sp. TaxID=3101308 RepID=UPI003C7BF173